MTKIFVITGRRDTELFPPIAKLTKAEAFKSMQSSYKATLADFEGEDEDSFNGSIDEDSATIETSGDWICWEITECTI